MKNLILSRLIIAAVFFCVSAAYAALPQVFDPNRAIFVRPGGTSYTWTYSTGTTPQAGFPGTYPVTQISYHDVPGFSWFLTRGRFEFSTNSGSSWSTYPAGINNNTSFTTTAGKIWRFVDTMGGDTTTTNSLGFAYFLGGGPSGSVGTGANILPDNAPTDLTPDRATVFDTLPQGSKLASVTPVDTGSTRDGWWVLESQSVPNLFAISFDRSVDNIVALTKSTGTMPAIGTVVTATLRYYDIYQTDSSGNPNPGQGFSKQLSFTVTSEVSNALTLGNDVPVNTFTTNNQSAASVARLSTGNLAVVWQSTSQGGKSPATNSGIYGQLLSSTGAAVGSEFVVSNAGAAVDEIAPAVTALASGRYVVTYSAKSGADYDIAYRIIEANGTVGSQLIANSTTAGSQSTPSIVTLTDGSFVIAWNSDTGEIRARQFAAAAGAPVAGEVLFDSAGYYASVAAISSGSYAVAWADNSNSEVKVKVSGGSTVSTGIFSAGYAPPRLAGLTGGGFVLASESYNSGTNQSQIEVARYNNSGTLQGAKFQANTVSTGNRYAASLAALTGGGFIVGWTADNGDFDLNGLFGRRYTSTGTAVDGAEFQINQHRSGDQAYPAITAMPSDAFASVWTDISPANITTFHGDIEARILAPASLSNNADLSALSLTTATLNQAFAANTLAYTSSVPNSTSSVTVTATRAQANATLEARVGANPFTTITSGTPSGALNLNVGSNTIDVRVTAQDTTTIKTYTITVTRAAAVSTTIYDFENVTNNATTFSSASQTWTLTGFMRAIIASGFGAPLAGNASPTTNGYMDTLVSTARSGNVGGIQAPTGYTFRAKSFDVWPSSSTGSNIYGGTDNQLGTVGLNYQVIGKLGGVTVATANVTDTARTPAQSGSAVGGYWHHLELGATFAATDIDTVEFVLVTQTGVAMNYLAVDNFEYSNLTLAAAVAPTVTTATQSSVAATSATLGGNVTANGGATVTERGIVWKTSTGPTTADNKVQNGSGTGAFSATVTGLPVGTTVFVRSYAINSVNTSYGSEISFTTLSDNANLAALTLTTATINEAFAANTTAYTSSVPNATSSVTVTATRAQANATLEARVGANAFAAITSGSPSAALPLAVGANTINVRVTAQDGTTQKTYTVTVTRNASAPVTPSAQWTQTVANGSPAYGRGKAVVKMSNNDVVSACQIDGGTASLANTLIIRHAAATGNAVWTRDLDKGRSDDVNDMVVDSAGNIYLAYRASVFGTSLYHLNWYVIKINGSTGAEMWTYNWAGSGEGNDEVFAINVCPDGNVVAVGNAEGGVRARAAKINASTGAEMWAFMESDNTTVRMLNCVACDSTGNIYAGGQWNLADAYMVKLNGSTGALTWSKTINGPGGGIDSAQDVVVDSADNPIFCGNFPATAGNGDSFVIKLNPTTNAETWRRVFTGDAAAQDGAATLKVDASNNVYVAGFVRNTLTAVTDRQAYVSKLSGTDGSVTWSFTKNGTAAAGANSTDRYYSMELANSSVYLCGTAANTSTDILLTRLDAANGSEQWSFAYDVAGATETLFGTRRHLVVTGADELTFIGESGTNGIVVKLGPGAVTSAPTVTTATQSAVTATSATLGGNVTADGGATVTERGIVWKTSTGPTTADNKVQNGNGTGAFSATVTGLPVGTTVFVRAYAINNVNTSYGSEISFTTLSNNADLASLTTTASGMTPVFGAATTAYTAIVPNGTTTTTVTATRAQTNATLEARVNGGSYSALTNGVASSALNLNVGANPIDIRVTAQDGTTQKTYTITVTRAAPLPNLTINDVATSEGNSGTTNFIFTVSLSTPAPAGGVTFDIATANGTATTANSDYVAQSLTGQTIPSGNSTYTFTVVVNGDTANEPNETFFANVTNVTGAVVTGGQGLGTINNDDPLPSLSINDPSVSEGNAGTSSLTFTATLSAASGQTVTVNYATSDGTATTGNSDYLSNSGTLTFTPGQTSKTIVVTINGDASFEPNETLFVNLSGATNATISDNQGTGTITNDDAPGVSIAAITNSAAEGTLPAGNTPFTFTVSRAGSTSGPVTMTYTVTGAAVNAADFGGTLPTGTFTIPDGQASAVLTIPVSKDLLVEPNETFTVTLTTPDNGYVISGAPASSTINNDDDATASIASITDGAEANSPTNGKFRVTQTAVSSTDTTLSYSVAGTASGGTDYSALAGTVIIPAGQTTADIDVTVLNDGTTLEPTETVLVTLTGIATTNNVTIGSPTAATVNITDDDTATVTIARITDGAETPTSALFRVTQTAQATVDTVITYTTGGTASSTDFTAPTGSVTIPAGQTTADITVVIANDPIVEPTETLSLTLTGFTARDQDVSLGATLTATADITDNDSATVSIAKVNDGAETNSPVAALFRVTQTAVSSTATTISYNVTGTAISGSDFSALSGSVTIPAGQTTADISVTVVNDSIVESTETVVATLNNITAGDPQISLGATVADTVNITDNDIPASIAVNSGSGQSATVNTAFASPLVAIVRDSGGVALEGASVTFASNGITASGAFGASSTVLTNSVGLATAPAFTANTISGAYTVSAATPGVIPTASFSLTNNPGAATKYLVTAPGSAIAGVPVNVTVTAQDAFNNTATAYAGTVRITSSDAAAILPANSTLTSGTRIFSVNFSTGGNQTVTATDTVSSGITGTSGTVTVSPRADLAITISDSPDPVNALGNFTYTIGLTNNGPSASVNPLVSLPLPAFTTFVSANGTAGWTRSSPTVGTNGTVTFSNATLASGASASFTVVAKVGLNVVNNSTITATATASETTVDPASGNNSAQTTTTARSGADLVATLTAVPAPVIAGTELTYSLRVKNNGPLAANNAALNITLPTGTTFVSLNTHSGWTGTTPAVGSGGIVSISNALFANAGDVTFPLVVKVGSAVVTGSILNATLAASSTTIDVGPGNESSSIASNVITRSDLGIELTSTPDITPKGSDVTHTLTLTNNGPSDAINPFVSFPIPAQMTFVSATAAAGWTPATPAIGSGGTVTFSKSGLANGTVASFTVVTKVKTTTANGTVIIATASASASGTDIVSVNDQDSTNAAVGTVNPTAFQLSTVGILNHQNGLFELTVNVTNTTPLPINGFRLRVNFSSYLAAHPSLRLYNATSAPGNSDVYVDYPYPVAVDGVIPVKLSFYTNTRTFPNPFSPVLTVETLPTSAVSDTNGSGVQPRFVSLNDGNVLLEFPSIPGRWYRVRYSHDLVNWFDSPVPIQASNNRMQWIDNGAPFTISPPSSVPSRFYRVNEINIIPAP